MNIEDGITASNKRFERLGWPLVQGWTGWRSLTRATLDDDYLGIDYWADGTPLQTRMQTGYSYRTLTIRMAEAHRLKAWAYSPLGEEPRHPDWWIQGYGDPLQRLYMTETWCLWSVCYRGKHYWGNNTQDDRTFAVVRVDDLPQCRIWEAP